MADTFLFVEEQQVVFTVLYAQMFHQMLQLCGLSNYYNPRSSEAAPNIIESIKQDRRKGNRFGVLFDLKRASEAYLKGIPKEATMQAQMAMDHLGLLP